MSEENGQAGARAGRRRKPVEQTPLQRALGLLTRREHSRRELSRKLASRGVEAADVRSAVDRLADEGWQSDTRFAEALVRSRASGGYGPLRIKAELSTHGLDREAIAAAMATFDGDWTETACDLVRRRFGPARRIEPGQARKIADFLIRRGFDATAVRAASQLEPEDWEGVA
ncbi:recombination regulator RecX [Pseudoxanthomonas japonensis]|uniref:Regulatory protein RecX n=1 Tax=Pseudoxanthomonas japonensis TaxID=69284 RepID=A0ABQ6ZD61_9GAMM|nr:recombination regulator RecX [Pseudoxanthomonas japonensis]KAF1722549.1 recombination regulator RecX [Pseudoxanthomonas japonensis]